MPTYYDYGLGLDDPTQITETGDELASAADYIEPENVDYAHYTWENQPISESVTHLIRDSDHPQLSSPLIYITIPSGSPHNIYDSTNTVLVSGNAQENNDRDFTLDYQLTGASADTGDITNTTAWSFTTSALEFGNTTVRTNIVSDMGPRAYDSVIVSRTPTLSPVITITTETSATTATEITIDGIASDPNSLPFTVTYELSGARTDTGTAAGTDNWTFTEGLSAGNNRFDVTAVNSWNLSGSDSLIVTYSPPAEGGNFFILPDEDVTLNGSFFGGGVGYWDRLDSGIDSGTPDDGNGVVGTEGDNWRFGFANPSFAGTSSEIIVRVRNKGDGDGNTFLRLYSDGSSSDGTYQWFASSSFGNYEKSFTIAKTAAQLTNLEVYVRADDYNDDWISEIEVEIVV